MSNRERAGFVGGGAGGTPQDQRAGASYFLPAATSSSIAVVTDFGRSMG